MHMNLYITLKPINIYIYNYMLIHKIYVRLLIKTKHLRDSISAVASQTQGPKINPRTQMKPASVVTEYVIPVLERQRQESSWGFLASLPNLLGSSRPLKDCLK